ncbi:MAG: serine hydrolase [Saprospiraceae bacterium]|nr:serine hydrolase [Saprospiraceae bacterium]
MKKQFFSALLVLFVSIAVAQKDPVIDANRLHTYYEKIVKDWDVPGMSVGIIKDGKLVFTGNYGTKEVGKAQKPDENTLYAIASNSKAFTSAIIAMLVQEGKLKWDDKVKDILPYFGLYGDPWISREVSIKDLLSHRVGLGTFSGDAIWYKSKLPAEELIQLFAHVPQEYDFRDGYGYSNLMYITAGEVIKKVTGKSWGENVEERILKPLGMNRTVTSLSEVKKKGNFATPHARKEGKNVPIEWVDWENVAATGGIISSVNDVAKWMIFNLNHGINGKDTLLTTASRNMVWKIHNPFMVNHVNRDAADTHFRGYGLGWVLGDYKGSMRVYHTGGYDGFITTVNLLPDENIGVVVLTNGLKTPFMAAAQYAMDMALGKEAVDWSEKMLAQNDADVEDNRITQIKKSRVLNTKPTHTPDKYAGSYFADTYGKITVKEENGKLRLNFEHTPEYAATLEHWHYDVWKINWDVMSAWYSFGTVQFNLDGNLKVKGMTFEVPNQDIFFEEIKPLKIE